VSFDCPRCGDSHSNINAAAQHLARRDDKEHEDVDDYQRAEKEVRDTHYGAPAADNSVVDSDPQAEARNELEEIQEARADSGVTNTADTGSTEPPEPPEPDIDEQPTCPECGEPGEPVRKLVRRWPDQLQTPPVDGFSHFCPDCTTADSNGAEIEVWNE
jgi:hypothetical protein